MAIIDFSNNIRDLCTPAHPLKDKSPYRTLKLLFVFLLALTLLIPAFLGSKRIVQKSFERKNLSYHVALHQASLSLVLIEEKSHEGTESESPRPVELCFTEIFTGIQNLKHLEVPGKSPQENFDTHPPLNLTHQVFQI